MSTAPSPNTVEQALAHLEDLSAGDLMLRREAIKDSCLFEGVHDYARMPDEALQELLLINRLLRRKNAGPPKAVKRSKADASIDDL